MTNTNTACFSHFMLRASECLIEDKEGMVVVRPGLVNRPDWLRPLLEFVHCRAMPDEYVLECVWLICQHYEDAFTSHTAEVEDAIADGMNVVAAEEMMTEDDIDFDRVVAEAGEDYSALNRLTKSLVRRWLMWKNGEAHWKHLGAAIAENQANDFEELISNGMRLQLEAVAERITLFYDDVLTQVPIAEESGK
jgi:hypothetical protein